ncbi:YifB family Mg chelatase-like AAA ATPase [Allostreptomyces psammosilenae]|uniref:Magnesium chelatase family protein n=1 Tax=Allostreptomyces psammosilenae TaxID=1892865 RepID=A0A853A2Q6_9ACTN|nr:YifB family Mg chelatase-like AAA ATPase [Allostreptomyces psammosilenae]NYI08417.1 magnesium chelatase family protein [Allostreptomyces psammosilenae]
MAFARTRSVALVGVDGVIIEVQADIEPGLACFTLVGLPDKSLNEARDRVRAAVVNSGEEWPQRRLTVGLSPAAVPKSGSGFDLAMACAVLAACEGVDPGALADLLLIGELSLDGRVRPVRGVLPAVLAAADAGFRQVVVPERNAGEAALVPDVSVLGIRSLRQLLAVLRGEPIPDEPHDVGDSGVRDPLSTAHSGAMLSRHGQGLYRPRLDMADVSGQPEARRAVEICAAGGHNLFLLGPPGAGKTMLAERMPGILPALTPAEALEVTAVHSVAGALPAGEPLVTEAPFCAPHHSTTMPAVVGGGSGLPRPGAVSLAHRGVLFLDEAPEFSARVLDALRQPLESGTVTIARAAGTLTLPARFQLVLAANPCPCGRFSVRNQDCGCTPVMRHRYLSRISGPLMDRVDVRVTMNALTHRDLLSTGGAEDTITVAERVRRARQRAIERLRDTPWRTNAEVPGHELRSRFPMAAGALAPAEQDMERGMLTARGLDRVLRVAWTIADLRGGDRPDRDDVETALGLRTGVLRGRLPAGGWS